MDETSVLIVIDWATKFQQIRFQEKQSDWYGKRKGGLISYPTMQQFESYYQRDRK